MPELTMPFGQLMADDPAFRNAGVTRAVNLVPREKSFGPLRMLSPISDALDSRCLGAISARDASDNVYVYAGDASKLYESVNNAFTDESKGGGYSTAVTDSWEFAVFETSRKVIATNYTDAVQSITIGGGSGGAFADMITSTNTPKAKHLGIVGPFVVLAYTNDSTDGERPNRVWWSAIRDEADFDPDSATQCDYDDLASGGTCQKVIGGTEYGLIFQQQMVRTMRYVGGGTIFDLLPLNFAPGTSIPNGVIAYKGNVFYIADSGFVALRGTQVQHIGTQRVDRFFLDQFDPQNRRYLSAGIDPVNKIVAWAFPGEGSSDLPNRLLMCHYDTLKWTEAEIDTELLISTETQGYTLDALDAIGTDIDDASVFDESLDSEKWKGGAFRFGAFDQLHRLNFFNGPTLGATIETGDLQPVSGLRWQIDGVFPLVDGGDIRVSVASRERLQDAVSYGQTAEMNVNGMCPLRAEGRYQRLRVSLSSSTCWSHAQGLTIPWTERGMR